LGSFCRNRKKSDSDAGKLCTILKPQWRMGRVFILCNFICYCDAIKDDKTAKGCLRRWLIFNWS
jgi:hypothetical protein